MPFVSEVRDYRNITSPSETRVCLTLLLLCLFSVIAITPRAYAADLVLVIDDIGYHLNRGNRLVDLPGEITLAMLPFAPHTPEIAERASRNHKEIILHQPMEPIPAAHVHNERGTLTLAMTPERFDHQFETALARVPQAIGVNNHTGSLLTAHREPMNLLMGNIQRRGLLFLDSRTTPRTVAESTARAWHIPTLRRDVFLDHDPSDAAIAGAFTQALRIARQRGHAVVIGHPYRSTLAFLEATLPVLPDDINLITLTELAHRQRQVRGLDQTSLARLESPASQRRLPVQ